MEKSSGGKETVKQQILEENFQNIRRF